MNVPLVRSSFTIASEEGDAVAVTLTSQLRNVVLLQSVLHSQQDYAPGAEMHFVVNPEPGKVAEKLQQ